MRKAREQTHHPVLSPRRVADDHPIAARLIGPIAVLLVASACNSLLGIGEASLACDDPPCAGDMASPAAGPSGAAPGEAGGAGSGGGRAPDAGTARGAAGAASNPVDTGGVPVGSSADRDGIPVAPTAPPASSSPADTNTASGQPASGGAGSGAGGDGGDSSNAAGAGGAPGSGGNAGAAPGSGAGGEPGQAPCNAGDACGECLCDACAEPLAACSDTPGCLEIIACARNSGCTGFSCYCGSADLLSCATSDRADGPCVAVMLAAPGSHPPSVADPNAGPASEAALEVANCSGQRCASACAD